jgi:hypothetical protein
MDSASRVEALTLNLCIVDAGQTTLHYYDLVSVRHNYEH